MARTKDELIAIRVHQSLRKSFEDALSKAGQFSSTTAFFEDCMRALIVAGRKKRAVVIPLELTVEADKPSS